MAWMHMPGAEPTLDPTSSGLFFEGVKAMPISVIALPLLVIAAAACPRPPPVKAFVVAGIDPLWVATDFNLATLRELADQANRGAAHPLYGFYRGDVADAIEVDIGNDNMTRASDRSLSE
jgi:hypothetical protein